MVAKWLHSKMKQIAETTDSIKESGKEVLTLVSQVTEATQLGSPRDNIDASCSSRSPSPRLMKKKQTMSSFSLSLDENEEEEVDDSTLVADDDLDLSLSLSHTQRSFSAVSDKRSALPLETMGVSSSTSTPLRVDSKRKTSGRGVKSVGKATRNDDLSEALAPSNKSPGNQHISNDHRNSHKNELKTKTTNQPIGRDSQNKKKASKPVMETPSNDVENGDTVSPLLKRISTDTENKLRKNVLMSQTQVIIIFL